MVVAAFIIGTTTIDALDGLFERFVLVDEVDPIAGEVWEHPRKRKAALVGAAHVVPHLMFESTAFGQHAFRRGRGAPNIRREAVVQHGADRLQVRSRHQVLSPAQAVHQPSPRLGEIRRP